MTEHVEVLRGIASLKWSKAEQAALDAAIAALARSEVPAGCEYAEAGFVVDGPNGFAFVPTRGLIEPNVREMCAENGDDPDDYTATQVYVRLTPIPPRPTTAEVQSED